MYVYTFAGFPKVIDQSEDRKKHQNMLRNHAIYLTIIFLLVVIIIGLVFVIWRGRNKQGEISDLICSLLLP